jgi:uncharacterized lipoprotein YmbA
MVVIVALLLDGCAGGGQAQEYVLVQAFARANGLLKDLINVFRIGLPGAM